MKNNVLLFFFRSSAQTVFDEDAEEPGEMGRKADDMPLRKMMCFCRELQSGAPGCLQRAGCNALATVVHLCISM